MSPTRGRRALVLAGSLVLGACAGSSGDRDRGADPTLVTAPATDPPDATPPPVAAPAAVPTAPPSTAPTSSPSVRTPPPATAPATSAPSGPTTGPVPADPMFGSFETPITLLTPATGQGGRPVLTWTPVEHADHYGAYLYAPDGSIYWAWQGYDTSIPVGGLPRLAPTSPGPSVTAGMSWAVIAYDAMSLPVAVSPLAEISP